MPQYRYQALDESQRPVAGEVGAETVSAAISALESRGLVVQSIIRTNSEPASTSAPHATGASDKMAFAGTARTARTATILEPGRQELQSLLTKTFERATAATAILRSFAQDVLSGSQRREMEQVVRTVEANNLERAVATFEGHAEWWMPLVGATAQASTPGAILDRFVQRLGPGRERAQQWWPAVVYPLFLAMLIFAVLTLFSFAVAPTFESVFDSFGMELPISTLALVGLTSWLRSWWVLLLLTVLILGMVLLFTSRTRSSSGHRWVTKELARLPAIFTPRRLRSQWIGRFADYTADALETGATMPAALRVAALAIERPSMRTAARRLADALERENVMPDPNVRERLSATVVYAAQAPLQLSAQVQLFREISRCQFELTNSRGGLVALFGPIWVILVGLFIGWMMLALLAPLASLVSALSG